MNEAYSQETNDETQLNKKMELISTGVQGCAPASITDCEPEHGSANVFQNKLQST